MFDYRRIPVYLYVLKTTNISGFFIKWASPRSLKLGFNMFQWSDLDENWGYLHDKTETAMSFSDTSEGVGQASVIHFVSVQRLHNNLKLKIKLTPRYANPRTENQEIHRPHRGITINNHPNLASSCLSLPKNSAKMWSHLNRCRRIEDNAFLMILRMTPATNAAETVQNGFKSNLKSSFFSMSVQGLWPMNIMLGNIVRNHLCVDFAICRNDEHNAYS